jgi:hypothetical protein
LGSRAAGCGNTEVLRIWGPPTCLRNPPAECFRSKFAQWSKGLLESQASPWHSRQLEEVEALMSTHPLPSHWLGLSHGHISVQQRLGNTDP